MRVHAERFREACTLDETDRTRSIAWGASSVDSTHGGVKDIGRSGLSTVPCPRARA